MKERFRNCAVPSCGTRKAKDIGFYRVPDDPVRRKGWCEACNIPYKESTILICWRHFKSDQFRNEINIENRKFSHLKKDALPTEFLPGKPIIVSQSNPDFDLGGSVDIQIPDPKIPSEPIIHTKLEDDHSYTTKTANPADEIKKLKRQVQLLKNKNASLRAGNLPEAVKKRVVTEKLKSKFSPGQISQILSKKPQKRCMKWEEQDYERGYKYRFIPKKQYNDLRKKHNFPLPGISTIDKKFQFVHVSPGFIMPSIEFLKKKCATLKASEKVIGLCFDEISIDNVVEIDQILDEAIGPAKNANVFWIRSITTNELLFPVFYELDQKSETLKTDLFNIIVKLEEIGYKVVSVTCDQGLVSQFSK